MSRAFAILLLLSLCGCAGYRMGPTNGMQAGARSLQVNLFQNDTLEPRLTEAVGTSLRRMIQRDGTYRLASQDDGDYILSGKITDFNRGALSFQPADVLTVRDYNLSMVADFKVVERATGKVILQTVSYGRSTVRAGADLAAAERQVVPLLAEDLARSITSQLVDGTW